MNCDHCNKSLPPGAILCPYCGTALQNAPPPVRTKPRSVASAAVVLTQEPSPAAERSLALSQSPSSLQPPPLGSPRTIIDRWKDLAPPLRAAVTMLVFMLGIQSVITAIPGLGFLLTIPAQIALYFCQGVLVAKFAREDSRFPLQPPSSLAIATTGWTILFCLGISLLVGLFESLASAGARLAALPLDLLTSLGSIIICMGFCTLGAWVYNKTDGKYLVAICLVVIGLVAAVTLAVILVAGTLLYHLFSH
jgi:hypothetical protein